MKNQKKNFLISFIFLLAVPFVIKYNKLTYINSDVLFLVISAIFPVTVGLQFSNYLLLEDKKNDIFPLLVRNKVSTYSYYLTKAMIPAGLATLFNLVLFALYPLFFNHLTPVFMGKLFLICLVLTLFVLFISEVLIFIVKSDVYYPTACVVSSIIIIGLIFYLVEPMSHLLIFVGITLILSLGGYGLFDSILKKKYRYFSGVEHGKD